jgi:peptidoglycan/LPS O-acetylase OafA/YrhL
MQEEYVVAYLRWSPVFAGAVLALALHRATTTTTSTSTAAHTAMTWLYRVKHCFFLLVSAVMCLLPWIVATARVLLVSSDASSTTPLTGMERLALTTPSGTLQKAPFGADLLFSVFSRAGFACAMCYLLFRAMLPHGHPLRLGWLDRVLSCISPLGKYSFGVYLLHNRILVSVVMGNLLTTPRLVQWTGSDSPVWHVAVVYAVVLALAGAGAVVMHVVVEKPLAPMTRRVLARVRVLLGVADSSAEKVKGKGGTKKAD